MVCLFLPNDHYRGSVDLGDLDLWLFSFFLVPPGLFELFVTARKGFLISLSDLYDKTVACLPVI